MNSLEELNYFSQGLIEFGDLRGPGLDWDGVAVNQSLTIFEGQAHTVPVGCELLSIRNYQALNVYYQIDLTNLAGTDVTWPTLPVYITENPQVGQVYRVSGLSNTDDWTLLKTTQITLPQNYSGTFTYTVTVGTILGVERTWTVTVTVLEVTLWEVPAPIMNDVISIPHYVTNSSGVNTFQTTQQRNIMLPNIVDAGNVPGVTYTVTISFNFSEMINAISTITNSVNHNYTGNFAVNSTTKTITLSGSKQNINQTLGIWDQAQLATNANYFPTYPGPSFTFNATPYAMDLAITFDAVSSLGEQEIITLYYLTAPGPITLAGGALAKLTPGINTLAVRHNSYVTYTPNTPKTINSGFFVIPSDTYLPSVSGLDVKGYQDVWDLEITARPTSAVSNITGAASIPANTIQAVAVSAFSGIVDALPASELNRNGQNVAVSASRPTSFVISRTQYDSIRSQGLLKVGDRITSAHHSIGAGTYYRIQSISTTTYAGQAQRYATITVANTSGTTALPSSSTAGATLPVTITSIESLNHLSAFSTSRNTFLITNTDYLSLVGQQPDVQIRVGDQLSAATYITQGQTVAAITTGILLNNITYVKITMSAVANGTSAATPGTTNVSIQSVNVTKLGYNKYSELNSLTPTLWNRVDLYSTQVNTNGNNVNTDQLLHQPPMKKIAINSTGEYVAVTSRTNTVRIFKLNGFGTAYELQQTIEISRPFGVSDLDLDQVVLNGAGDRLVFNLKWVTNNDANSSSKEWMNRRIYTYNRSGTTWTQSGFFEYTPGTLPEVEPFTSASTKNIRFGHSMAISANGNYLTLTVLYYPAWGTGNDTREEFTQDYALIYVYNSGVWQFQQKITLTGAYGAVSSGTYYGGAHCVNLDEDGNTLVCSGKDMAHVFTRAGTTWSKQTTIVGPQKTDRNANSYQNAGQFYSRDLWGSQSEITADGNRIVIAAAGSRIPDTNNIVVGYLQIYTRAGTTWTLQQTITMPTDLEPTVAGIPNPIFDIGFSLSGTGTMLSVTNSGFQLNNIGYAQSGVRIYRLNDNNQYVQQDLKTQSNSYVKKPYVAKISSNANAMITVGETNLIIIGDTDQRVPGFDYYRPALVYDYDAVTGVFSARGTSAGLNAMLNNLTVTPATGQTADYYLLYDLSIAYFNNARDNFLRTIRSEYWDNTGN